MRTERSVLTTLTKEDALTKLWTAGEEADSVTQKSNVTLEIQADAKTFNAKKDFPVNARKGKVTGLIPREVMYC